MKSQKDSKMFYAHLDAELRVQVVSENSEPSNALHMIEVDSYDLTLLGKVYKGGKVFADYLPPRKEVILARLAIIDTISDKPRTRRELALSKAATKDWLQTLEDEAAALRTELASLP
jgi:hypothetical protein